MSKGVAVVTGALLLSSVLLAERAPQRGRGDQKSGAASTTQSKFKGIWEPVNVKVDVELMSVHFTSADEGWVAGGKDAVSGGVILHTKDGGMTWETQLGDPQSSDRAYVDLRFSDPKTGFVVQSTSGGDHKLFRTTDGQNWTPIGTVGQHRTDFEFVTPETGFYTLRDDIFRSTDGGKKWQSVYSCKVKVEVQGLTRDVACQFANIAFVNSTVGYAISDEIGDAGFVVARTDDGGSNWKTWVALPGERTKEGDIHFFDENSGVLRTIDGKLFRSVDGGHVWTGVPGQAEGKPDFEFADAEVGWLARYQKVTYTNDGGKRWISSATKFPAMIVASSLPARDRGYVVGEHGMVYRYRVVPIDYTAPGMLPAAIIASPPPR